MTDDNQNSGNNTSEASTRPASVSPPSLVPPRVTKDGNKKSPYVVTIIIVTLLLAGSVAWGIMANSKAIKNQKRVETLQSDSRKLTNDLQKQTDDFKKQGDELNKLKATTGAENIDKKAFQAVFLKNGQVYFGKITKLNDAQLTLEKIYYLKSGSTTGKINPDSPGANASLVKLGNELHGPQDTMYIERKEVDFWENLKPTGEVSKAIAIYEKQNP